MGDSGFVVAAVAAAALTATTATIAAIAPRNTQPQPIPEPGVP
ncbi:MAG TPA: hypothetical protein VGH93_15215 [Solirubrobacteraceae bacterium]